MTTVGRWSPNKVRARVLDGTWVSPAEELGGMVLLTPTSIASTGSGNSSSIGANGSVTFSSCQTVSLNGVFSADYDNYMVSIRCSSTENDNYVGLRLVDSGTPAATNYTWQYLQATGTTVNAGRSSDSLAKIGNISSPQTNGITVTLYGPFLSQPTAIRNTNINSAASGAIVDYASTHSTPLGYDGFQLLPNFISGTFTGLVSVYGLVGA